MLLMAKGVEVWIPIQLGTLVQFILTAHTDSAGAYNHVFTVASILAGWAFGAYLLENINIVIKNWVGQKALFKLRTEVYRHIEHLPLQHYDQTAVGKLMTRTIHDVDQLNQLFSEGVIPIIGSLFLFCTIFVALFFINREIAVAMILLSPLIWWFTHRFRYYQRRSYDLLRTMIAAMNSFVQEHLMGISIIHYFGLEEQENKKFTQLNQDQLKTNFDVVHHFSLFFAGIDVMQNLTMIIVFVMLFVFMPEGSIFQAGTYFTMSLYGMMVFRPLVDLAERYNVLQAGIAAAERIFEVLDTPLEAKGPSSGIPLSGIETVVFEDVWFAYHEESWILKGVSFKIHQHESVALVGLTGSGKTSVMNLLLHLYEFQKGRILINGRDINAYAVADVRRCLGVILQDPIIFSGTIYDNIALYDPSISLKDVEKAAQRVSLESRLASLSGGLQYPLSEMGKSLSVGEMQLISLARAVAHKRDFLIFDEATANVDTPTEQTIQDVLNKILKTKTVLIIAHRFSTIRKVDRILVMDRGYLVENGSHEELLALNGIYEKLYRLQFV